MPFRVQAAAVDKLGVVHTQLLRPLVHHIHKQALRPSDMLSHSHRRVVGRGHGDTLDHGLHALGLPLLQEDLGTAHGGRVGRRRHRILHTDLSLGKGIEDQQKCHDLGDAGGWKLLMGILLQNHGSRGRLHQNRRGSRDAKGVPGRLCPLCPDGKAEGRQAQDKGHQQSQYFFHKIPLLSTLQLLKCNAKEKGFIPVILCRPDPRRAHGVPRTCRRDG